MNLRLIVLFVSVGCSLAGCGDDDAKPAPLAPWNGSWRAIETYMRGSAFEPVAAAIHELRPEYTSQEIQNIFAAGHDVDFTDLVVGDDSLTFSDGSTVVCAGRYEAATGHDDHHDDASHDHHGATFVFHLVEARGGDCAAYQEVAFGSEPEAVADPAGSVAHFHLLAGPARPAPWSPGVMTPIESARFTSNQLPNAPAYAQGLPAR